jgi:hypothetical protein
MAKKESRRPEIKFNKNPSLSFITTPQFEQEQKLPKPSKRRVTIKYDIGYPNQLYIRGKGANLNWGKGQPLKNIKADEWIWETDFLSSPCEFKVLINDHIYEQGDNHLLSAGSTLVYTPYFG